MAHTHTHSRSHILINTQLAVNTPSYCVTLCDKYRRDCEEDHCPKKKKEADGGYNSQYTSDLNEINMFP